MPISRHASWTRIRARDPEGLTPMERKVVDYERAGISRAVIAAVIGLAVSTVALHLWKASQRGVKLRRKLIRYRRWTSIERKTLTRRGTIRIRKTLRYRPGVAMVRRSGGSDS